MNNITLKSFAIIANAEIGSDSLIDILHFVCILLFLPTTIGGIIIFNTFIAGNHLDAS